MTMTTDEFRAHAEEYIDSSSLANAIGELAEIARKKAEHIRSNWQDEILAKTWETAANRIDTAERHAHNLGV